MRQHLSTATVGLLLSLAIGCGPQEDASSAGGPPGGAPMGTPVVAVPTTKRPVAEELQLIGTALANEYVVIQAETSGTLDTILFEEGQKVVAGQVLARLDQRKLISSMEEAQANLTLSETDFQRVTKLFQESLVSSQEFDTARRRLDADRALVALRKRQLDEAEVVAPFDGILGAREVSPGQVINRDQPLTALVDIDPIEIEFNVPERFLSVCEVGQSVRLQVAAYPESSFEGVVFFVAPLIDLQTRTAGVKARVANPDGRLLPGMFTTLDLILTVREEALVIPEAALFRLLPGDKAMVYVVDENQQAQLRTIQIGARLARVVEARAGLVEGEPVIVEGYQKIGPGSPVTLAPPQAAAVYMELDNAPGSETAPLN